MGNIYIIGGGAAGFFAAIQYKSLRPQDSVTILERGGKVLSKVKVSGGGRCNVTNACFSPDELVKFYPRGSKELRGPFQIFNPTHTVQWFEERGVALKAEADNRIFPLSDDSQTIIDCFLEEIHRKNIQIITGCNVQDILMQEDSTGESRFLLNTTTGIYYAAKVLIASGGSPQIWDMLKKVGHTIQEPLPSLFTFHVKDERIKDLAGVSVQSVLAAVKDTKLNETGALLVTHWGFSAPVILRLSAWGAKILAEKKYHFTLILNFLPDFTPSLFADYLIGLKNKYPKKQISTFSPEGLPLRLWKKIVEFSEIPETLTWADCSKKQILRLTDAITRAEFQVTGKSTFKEEFVTCGGVTLKEVDFKTMESKKVKGLFFAGEVLDIDAITGGFNFQAAWTAAWIAAKGMTH